MGVRVHVRVHANHTRTFAACSPVPPKKGAKTRRKVRVAEEGSEDEEGDEEGELLAPPLLTTAVGTCGDG
jgi:hypothetical protein